MGLKMKKKELVYFQYKEKHNEVIFFFQVSRTNTQKTRPKTLFFALGRVKSNPRSPISESNDKTLFIASLMHNEI